VQDILDNYIKEIDNNKEYIAFDILDCNLENEFSVESLYSQAENWIEQANQKFLHKGLEPLQSEYDKFHLDFD